MQFNYWLMDNYGASLTRLNQVSDLFFPEDEAAHFAMWHGACFLPNKKSEFKIYLNPQAKGKNETQDVIKETFKRLGLKESWLAVEAVLKEQDPSKNELKYFSLDLSAKPEARVKIYWNTVILQQKNWRKCIALRVIMYREMLPNFVRLLQIR